MSSSAAVIDPQPSALRDRALVTWCALGILLPCVAPNIGPLVLALSMAAPLMLANRAELARNLMRVGPVMAVHAVLVLYLCLNVLIAPVTDNAIGAIATIALGGLVCHVGIAAFPTIPARELRLMGRGLMIGGVVVAAVLFIEYVSRMSVLRTVQSAAEAINVRMVRMDAGTWERPMFTSLSRNLVVLIMLSWASIAVTWALVGQTRRQVVAPVLFGLVAAAALLSPSATAKTGLVAGAMAWLLCRYLPRLTAGLICTGWLTASLLCIPLSQLIHRFRLYDVDWFVSSFRHRMMIWSASSEWFWQHPWFGLGIGGARKVNLNDGLSISAPGITSEPLNWHAHNIFVQTWLETGALGGLLLCLFGLVLLRAIFRLPASAQAYAVATFVSIFVIGLAGFSLWAAWYLAAYGLAALFISMVDVVDRARAPLRGSVGG